MKRIDIIVGGRFHADQMAIPLMHACERFRLFTSYPRSRFGDLPRSVIHPFILPEIMFRVGSRIGMGEFGETFKMTRFGRAVARYQKNTYRADLIVSWSSFGLEAFKSSSQSLKILVRDSAHIVEQLSILRKEYDRLGVRFPYSSLTENREIEEYGLADLILVPSEYARASFLRRGISSTKLRTLRLAVDTSRFRPDPDWAPGAPLRIVYFGSISIPKGIPYLMEAVKSIPDSKIKLTLIGNAENALSSLIKTCSNVTHHVAVPQEQLAEKIRQADVFVMPTLHDGFGMALPQAMASGLVPIVTDHCGAAELVKDGVSGFIIPSRSSEAIAEKIKRLIADRDELITMRANALEGGQQRTWKQYGEDVRQLVYDLNDEREIIPRPSSAPRA